MSVETAADIFWFFFGYWSYYTMHNENGWPYDRAEKWLATTAQDALLQTRKIGARGNSRKTIMATETHTATEREPAKIRL